MKAILRTILSNLFAIYFINNVTGQDICNTNICLDWEMNVNSLKLSCRITNLHLRVFIDDPYGETQAVCLPPYPFICEAYYQNGSILYSTITQEVTFMLSRRTNRKVEGFWACRHGTGRDISRVFVSMINTTGSKSTLTVNSTDKKKDTASTQEQTSLAWSSKLIKFKTYSDLVTVNKELQSTQFMFTDVEQEQTNVKLGIILRKFYGLFIGVALLVLVMFVVCSIWISRRFRQIQLKIDARKQNHLNENEEQSVDLKDDTSERIDRISDYDSINENEMIPGPSSIVLGDKGSSSDTNNIATTHSCHDDTLSSDNSYLEVIDDSTYQNDYQSIEIYHGSDIVHDYCTTTSGINFLEMSSPVLTDKSLNEQSSICDTDVSISNDKLDITVQSESPKINAIVSEINGKTLFTVQPNCNRSNDGCIVPSHSMSTLL